MIEIEIPEGVEVSLSGKSLKAKGKNGEVEREFRGSPVEIAVEGNKVKVGAKSRAMEGTVAAHVRSMLKGVTEGFQKTLVMKYAHFPMSIEVKEKEVLIKNFLGEKVARKAKIHGNAKVEVNGQEIVVSGPDMEGVGQTAANIRQVTKVKGKDIRIFQDGIYIKG